MIANDLIKAFLVAWRGESLTGVDSVCNGKARYHCSDSKGKEKTEEGAGRGGVPSHLPVTAILSVRSFSEPPLEGARHSLVPSLVVPA